jgi:hypothetical protein
VLCESGLMTLRLVFLCLIVALAIAPQQAPTKAAEEDGFASLINEPDLTGWDGNQHAWKLDVGVLTGRSDGSSPAILVVSGREFGDFELRFEARVHRGAVRVKMHGPGPGPLGVALEINSATVEWFSNSASAFVVANNRPDEWKEYRVVVGEIGSRSGKTEYRLGWTLQSHMRTRRARCPCISQRANPLRSLCAESASRNRLLPKFHITPSGRNRGPKQHGKRGFRKVTSGSHGAAQATQDTAGWDVPTGR